MNVPPNALFTGLHLLPRDAPDNKSGGRNYGKHYHVDMKILSVAAGAKVNKINCILVE
jgi:hypothetical protein